MLENALTRSDRAAQPDGLQHVGASEASVHVELAQSVVEAASMRPFAPWLAQKVTKPRGALQETAPTEAISHAGAPPTALLAPNAKLTLRGAPGLHESLILLTENSLPELL